MREFEILKVIFAMGVLRHGFTPCITLRNICCDEGWIILVNIHCFELSWILMQLDECEQIVQIIFDMIYACKSDEHLQIVGVFEFIRIFNISIK